MIKKLQHNHENFLQSWADYRITFNYNRNHLPDVKMNVCVGFETAGRVPCESHHWQEPCEAASVHGWGHANYCLQGAHCLMRCHCLHQHVRRWAVGCGYARQQASLWGEIRVFVPLKIAYSVFSHSWICSTWMPGIRRGSWWLFMGHPL